MLSLTIFTGRDQITPFSSLLLKTFYLHVGWWEKGRYEELPDSSVFGLGSQPSSSIAKCCLLHMVVRESTNVQEAQPRARQTLLAWSCPPANNVVWNDHKCDWLCKGVTYGVPRKHFFKRSNLTSGVREVFFGKDVLCIIGKIIN